MYGNFLKLRDIYIMRVKIQQMEKWGQCHVQNVLDILPAILEKDQHANGIVMVDE